MEEGEEELSGGLFSGGFWAGGVKGAGDEEGMVDEGGFDGLTTGGFTTGGVAGSALEGIGGWDVEMEVIVPVKTGCLSPDDGVDGLGAGWEGGVAGWEGVTGVFEGFATGEFGDPPSGFDGLTAGWLEAGVAAGEGDEGRFMGGSAAWGNEESGLGC